jgi:hypothetical protein
MTPSLDAPFITEPLTWDQICERYPDEWVCLVDMDIINSDFDFRTARVVGHGKTRRAPLDQAGPWLAQYEGFGHLFARRCDPPSAHRRMDVEEL